MKKVLLVEDENLIRRGLKFQMDWTAVNCVVAVSYTHLAGIPQKAGGLAASGCIRQSFIYSLRLL